MRGAENPEGLAAFLAGRVQGRAIEMSRPRFPVTGPDDILITRSLDGGGASVRHRRGGALIGEVRFDDAWHAVYGGQASRGHTHQRGALAELLGLWNRGTTTPGHRGQEPQLQPPPVQTPLMQAWGVPAIKTFATPARSASDGARVTMANGEPDADDEGGGNGLTPKGQGIYKKLKAKGWDDAKAMKFAKRAQSFGGGGS
jgi:hypothetical protein